MFVGTTRSATARKNDKAIESGRRKYTHGRWWKYLMYLLLLLMLVFGER